MRSQTACMHKCLARLGPRLAHKCEASAHIWRRLAQSSQQCCISPPPFTRPFPPCAHHVATSRGHRTHCAACRRGVGGCCLVSCVGLCAGARGAVRCSSSAALVFALRGGRRWPGVGAGGATAALRDRAAHTRARGAAVGAFGGAACAGSAGCRGCRRVSLAVAAHLGRVTGRDLA